MELTTNKEMQIYYDILPGILEFGKSINFTASELEKLKEECSNIATILAGNKTPSFFYNFMGHGCYKLAYSIDRLDLVLKFCSNYTIIQDEIDQYNAAQRTHFGKIFLPTYSFLLPEEYWLKMSSLSDAEFDDDCICFIEIQPLAEPMECAISDDISHSMEKGDQYFEVHFLNDFFDNHAISYEIIKQNGETYYQDLKAFLEKLNIYDFHNGNMGFYFPNCGEMLPVLLDW